MLALGTSRTTPETCSLSAEAPEGVDPLDSCFSHCLQKREKVPLSLATLAWMLRSDGESPGPRKSSEI